MRSGEWSHEEIDFLRKNFMKMSYSKMGKILGRSTDAVRVRIQKLGLNKRSRRVSKESLCFYCANARAGRCAWVDRKTRVWQKAEIKDTAKDGRLYIVKSCKNFIPDVRDVREEAMRA